MHTLAGMPDDTRTAERRLLKPQEAWEYLGISKPKLYELTNSGEIAYINMPARRPGGRGDRRYELSELERFIDKHRVG